MNFPDTLRYTPSHEWISVDGAKARVGISSFAQKELGDIVFVELPQVGRTVKAEEACCVVESVKTASDIYSPVAGTVTAVNEDLDKHPELINEDCYGKGWIFELELSDASQVDKLLDATTYEESYAT